MKTNLNEKLTQRRLQLEESFGKEYSKSAVARRVDADLVNLIQWEQEQSYPSTLARLDRWARALKGRLVIDLTI
jgi:hypothetical protein